MNTLPGYYSSSYDNMTECGHYRDTVVSNITLSLFADSGWYTVDRKLVNSELFWGSGNLMLVIIYVIITAIDRFRL